MTNNSNTVPKQLKPFVKGDPRINRKGRPKSFDALRALALEIAHETAKLPKSKGGGDLVINGHKVTVAEEILRQWSQNKQKAFIEIAFGKVPDILEVPGEVVIRVVHDNNKK